MPAVTVYLSRVIGLGALVIGIVMLADKVLVMKAVEHLGMDSAALLSLGLVRVVIGGAIVLTHNVWSRGVWPLLVTLTGWTMLVRGVMNVFVPTEVMAGILAAARVADFYYLYAAIPLVLGAYLTLRGFAATAGVPGPNAPIGPAQKT